MKRAGVSEFLRNAHAGPRRTCRFLAETPLLARRDRATRVARRIVAAPNVDVYGCATTGARQIAAPERLRRANGSVNENLRTLGHLERRRRSPVRGSRTADAGGT